MKDIVKKKKWEFEKRGHKFTLTAAIKTCGSFDKSKLILTIDGEHGCEYEANLNDSKRAITFIDIHIKDHESGKMVKLGGLYLDNFDEVKNYMHELEQLCTYNNLLRNNDLETLKELKAIGDRVNCVDMKVTYQTEDGNQVIDYKFILIVNEEKLELNKNVIEIFDTYGDTIDVEETITPNYQISSYKGEEIVYNANRDCPAWERYFYKKGWCVVRELTENEKIAIEYMRNVYTIQDIFEVLDLLKEQI